MMYDVDSMTEWQKKQEIAKTDKAKRWLHACGRKGQFDRVEQITKDTYICSLHFVGGKGPTDDNQWIIAIHILQD